MAGLKKYFRYAGDALRPGGLGPAARDIRHRLDSTDRSYGLSRDLREPHVTPRASIPITIRPLVDADVPAILENGRDLPPEENWERRSRRALLEAGIGQPFVAATEEDEPCYVQWLFGDRENEAILRFFKGIFPTLDPDTALLEGAFTPTAHRGKRIMSSAMSMIAEQAATVGARYVVTFVGLDNAASLKGCARAGFDPYTERTQRSHLGRTSVAFAPVAENTPSV